MPENKDTNSTAVKWPRARRIRFCVLLSIALYVVSVVMLTILRIATNWITSSTVAEMLYGPAITIASTWIIFGIAALVIRRSSG